MQSFFSGFFDVQSIMLTNRKMGKVDKNLGGLKTILDILFCPFFIFQKTFKRTY